MTQELATPASVSKSSDATSELAALEADTDAECARVESSCPGWRCVWLPRQSAYLAFPEVEPRAMGVQLHPAVAHSDADAVIADLLDLNATSRAGASEG